MEEHTLQPGAEEQKKPQNTIDETSEEAQTKEEVVPIESPAKGLDKSKKTKQEVIEKVLLSQEISHGHPHDGNFCLRFFRDQENRPDFTRTPRLYLIDFDQAISSDN